MKGVGQLNAIYRFSFAFIILVVGSSSLVSGGGILLVRLVEYDNWSGTTSDGQCCDGVVCACDHYFKLCLDTGLSSDNMQRCSMGNTTTGVFTNKNVIKFNSTLEGGSNNPVQFNFTRWNLSGIRLKIQVYDKDETTDELVDFFKVTYNSTPSRTESEAQWTTLIVSERTSMTMNVKSFCSSNWYGPKCDVLCSPPSASARYECDVATGNRICLPGWTGRTCSTQIDECACSPCQNGGVCVDRVNGYSCQCPKGLAGDHCTLTVDHCASNPCQGEGSKCVPSEDEYLCHCSPGFSGPDCSIFDRDLCGTELCYAEGGTCIWNGSTSYVCTCKPGWTGPACSVNIDDCASNPCHGFSSECEDLIDGYRCRCSPGLAGPQCTIDDPEACDGVRCYAHGGMCSWRMGSGYSCQCLPGWSGASCDKSTNHCHGNGEVCLNGGTCIDLGNTFRCICDLGWSGETCSINIDECSSGPCHGEGTVCVDEIGGYQCHCSPGLTGSQCHIPDSDACGPHRCFADGGTCQWSSLTNYTCVCKPGYGGDECKVHMDECSSNPCHGNGSICEDVVNGFQCHCRPGLTGPQCDVTEPEACGPFRCSTKGGKCTLDSFYQYFCRCNWGWTGEDCSVNFDECSSNPCRGRGSHCEDLVDGYRCHCSPGLTGAQCGVPDPDACGPVRCHATGGICTWNPLSDYRCTCRNGWTGIECSINIEERTSGCNCMMQRVSGKECLERCSSSTGSSSTTEVIFYGRLNSFDVSRVIDGIIDHTVLVDRIPSSNLSVVYNVRHCVNKRRMPITKFEYMLHRRDANRTPVKYSSVDDVIEFLPYPVTSDDTSHCRFANDSSFEPVRLSKTSYALPMLVGGIIFFAVVLLTVCFFTTRLYGRVKGTEQKEKSDVEKPATSCNSNSDQLPNSRRRDDVVTVFTGEVGNQVRQEPASFSQDDYLGIRRVNDERSATPLFGNKNNTANREEIIDEIDDDDFTAAEKLPLRQKNDISNKRRAADRRKSIDELPVQYRDMFTDNVQELDA